MKADESQYYLAVNTSLSLGQLCLFQGKKCIAEKSWDKQGSHSERVTAYFIDLLKETGISKNQLNKIACVHGPGSFTGIRVGVSFAKALAYSLNIAILPINTLNLLSYNCSKDDLNILCLIDAQKNSLFVSEYQIENHKRVIIQENQIYELSQLTKLLDEKKYICGDGLSRYEPYLTTEDKQKILHKPHWQFCDLKKYFALKDRHQITGVAWNFFEPLYIKNSAAEEKRNEQTLV